MTVRAWAGLNVTAKWLPTQIGNAYHDLFQTSSKLRSNVYALYSKHSASILAWTIFVSEVSIQAVSAELHREHVRDREQLPPLLATAHAEHTATRAQTPQGEGGGGGGWGQGVRGLAAVERMRARCEAALPPPHPLLPSSSHSSSSSWPAPP